MKKFTFKKLFAKGMRVFVAILTVSALSFPNGLVITSFAGGVTVSGKVFKPDGVTPAANVWVQLHTPDWTTFNSGASTNTNGEYVISGPERSSLPAGNYVLEIQVPFSNPDGFLAPEPAQVVVGTTSLTGQNFIFKNATKTLTGKVARKTGAGVEGANVNANRVGGAPAWANAQTNASGDFTLRISGGNWMVSVNPNSGPDAPAVDWIYMDQPQQITFNGDETAESKMVNFVVTNASATINGTVQTSSGVALTQGSVDARSSDGRGAWGQIKPDGTFSLRVPAGGYDIFARVGGPGADGKYSIPSAHVDIGDNQTQTVNIVAKERLGKITGQMTDKSGAPVKKVMINANRDNGQGQGPGEFSNAMSDDAGNFVLSVSAGRWRLNVNQGPDSPPYAYDGQPIEVIVPGDDAVVSGVNIQLTFVDAKITGRVVNEAGEVISNFPGYAFARPTTVVPGTPFREYGGPVMNGQFNIQLPSSVASTVTIGIHTPPGSDYASAADQTVVVIANSTVTKDIVLIKNNARVYGRVMDASGFPLSSCNFRGDVFLNSFKGDWRGGQIKSDCTFSISTTPGTYQFGYNFDGSAGFMNRPPAPDPIKINSGDSIERNIKVVSGDATITGKVLDPDGNPVPNVFIFADNREEIDQFRNEAGDGPRGPGGLKPGENEDGPKGLERNGPGGAKNPKEIFDYCKNPKNAQECKDFKLPEGSKGPGGCTNALECVNYCKTNQSECFGQEATMKPPTGGQPGTFSGPGGCKTEAECKAFCSKPENFDACRQFGPPPGEPKPQGVEESKFSSSKGPDDVFDKMINSGSQSDANGNFTIKILSGHKYSVGAGLPPESKFLPAKFQKADLTKSKSAFITMQLRTADAKLSGVVLKDGKAVTQGFVRAWAEDGGFSGSPIINGGYSLNLTKGTVWHVGADSPSGRDLYRSPEITVVVEAEKNIKKNFTLGKSTFVVPPPMSVTFDSAETKVIALEDGTTITIPSGALDDSGSVTVTANPTVDIQGRRTAKPVGVGYKLEATDSDGRTVTKFNSNVTVKFVYADKQLEEAGLSEEALVPSFYDSSSNSWNRVTNATQDTDNNTVVIQTDHFSAYALTDTSGKARGKSTKQISAGKNKAGVATLSIGIGSTVKTITPFSGYKGAIEAKTANLGGKTGQVTVIAPSEKTTKTSEVIVVNAAGKKIKSFQPFGGSYKAGVNILFKDLTGDGKEDLAMSPVNGKAEVKVYDFAKNKTATVDLGRAGYHDNVNMESLEAFTKGVGALTTVTTYGRTTQTKVFKYNSSKGAFDYQKTFDTAKRVSVATNGTISLVTPKPKISNLAPKQITYTADATTTVKVNAPGENYAKDTIVLIGGVTPAAVKYKTDKLIELTITPSKLQKGKTYDIVVVGSDGAKSLAKKVLTVK